MVIDFTDLSYLKQGNARQQLAYREITEYHILENLQKYHPILVGTIPLDIDVPESDLDVICECHDHLEFKIHLQRQFSYLEGFRTYSQLQNGIESTIAEFRTPHFLFEIFGQQIPSKKQNAYRHMLIEHQILLDKGDDFKQQIIDLKLKGLKTEPAFAKLLRLTGDPYLALLNFSEDY